MNDPYKEIKEMFSHIQVADRKPNGKYLILFIALGMNVTNIQRIVYEGVIDISTPESLVKFEWFLLEKYRYMIPVPVTQLLILNIIEFKNDNGNRKEVN